MAIVSNSQSQNLEKNIDINNNDSFKGFEMLDSHIAIHRLILTGEDHYFLNKNISIEMKLFRYLVKKHGVNHLLIEFGYSFQQMINIYLKSEDVTEIEGFDKWKDESSINYFKNLRTLYQSRPDTQKFVVHGIDVERFYSFPIIYMNYLLPKDKTVPDELAVAIETLIKFKKYLDEDHTSDEISANEPDYKQSNYMNKYKTMCILVKDFDSLNLYYKDYLGQNFADFENVIRSVKDMVFYKSLSETPKQNVFRENYIFKRFEKVANSFPDDKFYGQFGRCHSCNFNSDNNVYEFNLPNFTKRIKQGHNFNKPCESFTIALAYYNPNLKNSSQGEFGSFINKTGKNRTAIFPLYKGYYDLGLVKKFDFIIAIKKSVNRIEVENELPQYKGRTWYAYSYSRWISFGPTYGQYAINLSNLNSSLVKYHFNSPLQGFGFDYFIDAKDATASGGFSLLFFNKQKTTLQNDTNFSLDGYNISGQIGYDLIQSTHRVSITPMIGLSFQQLKLSSTLKNVPDNFPYSTNQAFPVYKNPAIILTPQIDLRFTLFDGLGLGAKMGYGFDISNEKWRANGKRRETNANVNQSAWFFETKLSIVIYE